jgi:hypothetical protein
MTMSNQGDPSGSERSLLIPKRGVEHHEVQPSPGPGGEVIPSDKPEKSQAMVMYVYHYYLLRPLVWYVADNQDSIDGLDAPLRMECGFPRSPFTGFTKLLRRMSSISMTG